MVCDGAFVASTLASIMMNGVCCVWQMQEEEDRREALRSDIRAEYDRQRVMDEQIWQQWLDDSANTSSRDCSSQEDRRRRLIRSKIRAAQYASSQSKVSRLSQSLADLQRSGNRLRHWQQTCRTSEEANGQPGKALMNSKMNKSLLDGAPDNEDEDSMISVPLR